MNKIISLAFAAAILAISSAAMAQTAPPDLGPSHKKMDPAIFAQHKQALLAARFKTDSCIKAASDPRGVMSCIKTERESLREQREARGSREGKDGPHDSPRGYQPIPAGQPQIQPSR